MKKPVLLLIFNRPQTTRAVCAAIRAYRPERLFIAADGPRDGHPADATDCAQARQAALAVDWPCEVSTLFHEHNLGCRRAVAQGISWFFQQVEEGIILEDDCLPAPDFFRFCGELLDYYRDERLVMHITGANFQNGVRRGDGSYYVSRFAQVWGWASWRRAWERYDERMPDLPEFLRTGRLREIFPLEPYKRWRLRQVLQKTYEDAPHFHTWDYQWLYTLLRDGGYALNANVNLVSNIGLSATHRVDPRLCNLPAAGLPERLSHPPVLAPDPAADAHTFARFYRGSYKDRLRYTYDRLRALTGTTGEMP